MPENSQAIRTRITTSNLGPSCHQVADHSEAIRAHCRRYELREHTKGLIAPGRWVDSLQDKPLIRNRLTLGRKRLFAVQLKSIHRLSFLVSASKSSAIFCRSNSAFR